MSIFKARNIQKMKVKKYLLYAIGEFILIVAGILLALSINNRNESERYKSQIDNNILRVYNELDKNINQGKKTIDILRGKDSLIYLVMMDSLDKEDYNTSLDVPFLIMQNAQLRFEEKAIQNLTEFNIFSDSYKEELLSSIRELYSLMKTVNTQSENMGEFIAEKSIPLLADNIKSFGDLTYKREIKEDALDYFLNSEEYKSYVSRYAIYGTRMQLEANRNFYKKALEVYHSISEEYSLDNKNKMKYSEQMISNYQGKFVREDYPDTLEIRFENDSLFAGKGNEVNTLLIPLSGNQFFLDGEGQERYFVSFHQEDNEPENIKMNLNIFSSRFTFKKIETK